MVAQAIGTARAVGATGQILVRGDSAYGTRAVVGRACARGAAFSLVMTRNPRDRARHRRDRRGRLDAGALSRCGARSRHRRLDL